MLDGLAEPPTQQDRQTVALFGELVLPCRVIVDDLNRHIDHGPSVFRVRSTAIGDQLAPSGPRATSSEGAPSPRDG
jgi:hypothetical protein